MSENQSNLSKSDDVFEWWADVYSTQPLIRALFAAATALPIPLGAGLAAIGKELMDAGVQSMLRERSREFFDELASGERYLTKELIQQEDFLQSFFATWRAAMRTRNRKKIRCFSRLLLSGIRENQLGHDTFDEFLSILNELSMREMEILRILKEFEDVHPHQTISPDDAQSRIEKDTQPWRRFWSDFEATVTAECDVTSDTLSPMLSRLAKTGLYEPITGLIFGYSGGQGRTTPLFAEFSKWIESEAAKAEQK